MFIQVRFVFKFNDITISEYFLEHILLITFYKKSSNKKNIVYQAQIFRHPEIYFNKDIIYDQVND